MAAGGPGDAGAVAVVVLRLGRLRFAASGADTQNPLALILGALLPPLPGQRFVRAGRVAIPCGWRCDPQVDAQTLEKLLAIGAAELALITTDGAYEVIPDEAFVAASRSAVRLSDLSIKSSRMERMEANAGV